MPVDTLSCYNQKTMSNYKTRISTPLYGLIVSTLGSVIYYFGYAEFIDITISFTLLTVILLIYLVIENIRLYKYDSRRFFANPAFLCSLMTLGLYYGANNFLFLMSPETLALISFKPIITPNMVKLVYISIIAAVGMWVGYWSKFTTLIINSNYCQRKIHDYFTFDADLKNGALYAVTFVGLISRLLQIRMGIYGYSGSYEAFMDAAKYMQYFVLGGYFGKIALIVITLQYYAKPPTLKTKIWFYSIIILEVYLGGFLSGFKKMVMIPFAIVFLCQYIRTGRLNIIWIVAIVISTQIAYPVIEQFRSIRNGMGDSFPSSSVVDITQIMFFPTEEQKEKSLADDEETNAPVYLKVMARTSMTQIGSYGLDYYDKYNGNMPTGSPEVIKEIFLSPLYSWIPRFIWSGKTVQNIGLWYTQEVMQLKYSFSSTAMGFITYLYIGGGLLMVFLGFLFIGALQRITREVFRPWQTSAGALLSLSTVAMVSSIAEYNMDALIVLLVRMIPIVMWLQVLLYDHKSAHKQAQKNSQ